MDQLLDQFDIYGVLATVLSVILATVVPYISFKYRKLLAVLRECKATLKTILEAWKDCEISPEEAKTIMKSIIKIIDTIKE